MSRARHKPKTGPDSVDSSAITALVLEARRRGVTYGALVSDTTRAERTKIIKAYREKMA